MKPHLQAMNGDLSLGQRYLDVKQRIERATMAAGRPAGTVNLLAVSKTFSAERVRELAQAGQRAFGENYLQEALGKIAALAPQQSEDLPADGPLPPGQLLPGPLEWHFIGPIQSNKTRKIAEAFDWVHSVEQEKIARRLSDQRPTHLAPLNVCLQVNVSGEASKSGCAPRDVMALVDAVALLPGLVLRGLMAIPEPTDDPALQTRRFDQVRELFLHAQNELRARPQSKEAAAAFDTLSMGMSADLEAAIAAGATIVRVGSALFGERPTAQ